MLQILNRLSALLLVVLSLALGALAGWDVWGQYFSFNTTPASDEQTLCTQMLNPGTRISRPSLAWLIGLPVGSAQAQVTGRLGTPYCLLEGSGGLTQFAYPCEWEPSTWLVITFQDEQYAGYEFSFEHSQV